MLNIEEIDYLITGGLGFIGLNFVLKLHEKYPDKKIKIIDKMSLQSNAPAHLPNHPNITILITDINDFPTKHLFQTCKISNIVHFAAESHVDRSITSPLPFVESNIVGTFNLLEYTRIYQPKARFHHVSTDEVYGSCAGASFTEMSACDPSSVYSASKAASDMLVNSYIKTYGLRASISNCSNNFGLFQNEEKMIPKYIHSLSMHKKFPLYNKGKNVREWIHVDDHNTAILRILESKIYEKFNVGSGLEFQNIQILKRIHEVYQKHFVVELEFDNTVEHVKDRLGHDFRYSISDFKYVSAFGKNQCRSILDESTILDLIEFYKDKN